jgi:hypothetical protein
MMRLKNEDDEGQEEEKEDERNKGEGLKRSNIVNDKQR